ncbi:MAG: hypothetical protein E6G56_04380 [Actinobacteria bacterium]|nr:MAG: hypothetical protein E6G56_04380 [Actinomycetota bacterium]
MNPTATTQQTVTAPAQDTPERVAALRELAARDSVAAQDGAWGWFERLGRLAITDRAAGSAQLADVFACGRPVQGIDGPTDGILVTTLIHPAVDRLARGLTALWMPWKGKNFHAIQERGENRLTPSTQWLARLVWPRYATRATEGGRLAFDFQTRVEPGAVEPAVDVLVIDYAPVQSNPRLGIKSIRDELVEIVPGGHLGRILYRLSGGGYRNLGYFALREPAAPDSPNSVPAPIA